MNRKGYSMLIDDDDESSQRPDSRKLRKTGSNEHGSMGIVPQAQNVKGKNVYVFSDGRVADDEDDNIELTALTQRGNMRTYRATSSSVNPGKIPDDIVLKEIPLLKDDTLQSLSVKFRCSVADIKRVNGLYSDMEFYGCKTIKIPVRSHQRILQQELEQIAKDREANPDAGISRAHCGADAVSSEVSDDEAGQTSHNVEDIFIPHDDTEDMDSIALLDRTPAWSNNKSKNVNGAERDRRKFDKIISRKDHEIREIIEKVQQQSNALDEVTAVMRTPPSLLGPQPPLRRNCPNLAPSLPCVIISAVIALIVVPIFLFFYVKKDHHFGT